MLTPLSTYTVRILAATNQEGMVYVKDVLYDLVSFDASSPHIEAVIALSRRVWEYDQPQIRHYATYPGFKGIAALSPSGTLIGYVYGTTALAGQW